MIDLHCHLLPGIDDGPESLEEALALARLSVAQGITTVACTSHILPGVYDNVGPALREATARMRTALDAAGIPLRLVTGSDLHMSPDNAARLRSGQALSLGDTRYVLIEPPHHVLPPRTDHAFFDLAAAGYAPILTHPERMTWIERGYDLLKGLARADVLMQVTAAAFTGGFGRRPRYWAERLLDDDLVDIVATDAHDAVNRPPVLMEAFEAVSLRVGSERARRIFIETPEAILDNRPVARRIPADRMPLAGDGPSSRNWFKVGVEWMRRS